MDENWDGIADWYAELVRSGSPMHEFSRDILMSALPDDLTGANVLDVGCGEGLITRALAARGAKVVGVDPTAVLIDHARAAERTSPLGASFELDDGATLATVATATIDWVTAGLSLNNIPNLARAVESCHRVLRPGGRLTFTVPHPCFEAPRANSMTIEGRVRRVVGDYLEEGLWRNSNVHSVRRAGNHHRTIATYVDALLSCNFTLERLAEPVPDDRVNAASPHRAGLPPFLLLQAAS